MIKSLILNNFGRVKFYLVCEDNNIASIGAVFLGKSATGSMECVHCMTVEAEVRPLWAGPPAEADGNLR